MTTDRTQQAHPATMNLAAAGSILGAAIAATREYAEFRAVEQRYQNDTQAQELLSQYQEAQRTMQLMRQLGNATSDETQRLEELQRALEENQTLVDYFDAQEKLVALLRELNMFISERLNLDFAGLTKPKSGCCG